MSVRETVQSAVAQASWQARLAWRGPAGTRVRKALWPVVRHRFLLERAKYAGNTILDPQQGNDYLASFVGQRPAAVGRLGGTELKCLVHYFKHKDRNGNCRVPWGANGTELYVNSGVYPSDTETLTRWSRLYVDCLAQLDVLGVWFRFGEHSVWSGYARQAKLMRLIALEPYYHERPWSQHLAGKRVLVMSPFVRSIQAQYENRREVWAAKPEVMPDFELRTIRIPLSAGLTKGTPEYPTWFDGLDALRGKMTQMMQAYPYDVCIVGAGAWSLPLITHAKSLGAWGIHMGGPTQVLFGLMGGRWENNESVTRYVNSAWKRPGDAERPADYKINENGCYW